MLTAKTSTFMACIKHGWWLDGGHVTRRMIHGQGFPTKVKVLTDWSVVGKGCIIK